jgi:hypothetical protein
LVQIIIILNLATSINRNLNARPSDMAFKGFESMYYFSRLLLKYNNDMLNNLSDTKFKIANSFTLQPVKLTANAQVPDYIETRNYILLRDR